MDEMIDSTQILALVAAHAASVARVFWVVETDVGVLVILLLLLIPEVVPWDFKKNPILDRSNKRELYISVERLGCK